MGAGMISHMRTMRRDESVLKSEIPKGTTRRIMTFARQYRVQLAIFLFLITIDAALGTVNPLILREIINEGIIAKDTKVVIDFALLAGGLAVIDAGLGIVERFISSRVGEGLIYDMRSRVFTHIQEMPVAFFTRTQTGALVSRLNNDVLGAQQAFTDVLSNVVSNIVTVALVLVAMFILSWQITIVSLVLLPLFVFPAKRVGRRLQRITRESYNLNSEMTMMMSERFNVAGALLVKIFGHPAIERDQFNSRAGRVRDIGIQQAMLGRVFFSSLLLTASLATALVYGWGGVLAIHGTLNVGTVVALTAYLTRLYGPLTALSNVQVDVMTALVSFDRVFEVLDLKPMIEESPTAVEIPRGDATVEFDHVQFSYPSAQEISLASLEAVAVLERTQRVDVLHDVSFTVQPGSLTALVGHSGAGKTTIGALVARLYDVDQGTVSINGVNVRDASFASVRDEVGIVTQDAHLFHDTVRANLLYARPEATDEQMREALLGAQILPLIDSLPQGIDTIVGDRGYRLSGGEKQRVAIARMLLKAPDVIVLDEATAHLDAESELAVQDALDQALVGRTSIVIAHRLSTIRKADQILVIEAGRIAERGTHDELLATGGIYNELYRTQFADPNADESKDDDPEQDPPE
jgi:ATP-binding cassette, subfamily B, bacterial